jgi:hypothetical protein
MREVAKIAVGIPLFQFFKFSLWDLKLHPWLIYSRIVSVRAWGALSKLNNQLRKTNCDSPHQQ